MITITNNNKKLVETFTLITNDIFIKVIVIILVILLLNSNNQEKMISNYFQTHEKVKSISLFFDVPIEYIMTNSSYSDSQIEKSSRVDIGT